MPYSITLISPEERDDLYSKLEPRLLYSAKSEIYGTCIRLLTDQLDTKNTWEDNFYQMSESVRSHGRLVVLQDKDQETGVKYEPLTRTVFLFNLDYYGWVKSIALALAGDFLEDHQIYSVHGAAFDMAGSGVSLIAPSKSGKTTQSWGLLRMKEARLITDDWYFVQLSTKRPLCFGSEKNCYIEADIASIWPEYKGLVESAHFDNKGRAIVNVRWTIGKGGVIPITTMRHILLLERDPTEPRRSMHMSTDEALEYLVKNDFCNPHLLIRNDRKKKIRERFFKDYLGACDVHMINTTGTPQETQEIIKEIIAEAPHD